MKQLSEVFSAISPTYRHRLLEEARQQRGVDRSHSEKNTPKPSAHSCSTCSYFMRGVKPGEPDTCNAFHDPTQNICAVNECTDWELR